MNRADATTARGPPTPVSLELGDSTHASHHQQQHQEQSLSSSDAGSNVPARHSTPPPPAENQPFKPTRRFWLVLLSISALSLCGAVEATIVINALPTIVAALGGGNLYLWVPNAYWLASVAALPLYAQSCNIFGRRALLLGANVLFVLGCALGGASTSMTMLIVARTMQGLGSGGIDTILETIIIDLVPLRERSKYMSFVAVGATFGFTAGPFLGGLIVAKLGWPWVFYLNTILSSVSLVMFFFFVRVKHRRGQSTLSKIKRIDFGGNAIFVGAVVAVLLALTWVGPVYSWDSAHILVPLVIGLSGFGAFTAFEWTPRLAPEPSFPRIIVSNRTSSAVLAMTMIHSIIATGTFYFLPVYFQGVLVKSPLQSGIALAPICAALLPLSMVSGILMAKVGKYRPIHIFAWSATLLSVGLCSSLNRQSLPAAWIVFQVLCAAGIGSLSVSLLPALQAPLSQRHAATSAGVYTFARGFGNIWGVTIPAAVFNNIVKHRVTADGSILATNPTLAASLANGQAYQFATKAFLDSLPSSDGAAREQIISIFEHAIQVVFYVLIAFAVVGLLLMLLEKEIPMRTENNTEFGLEDNERSDETTRAGNDEGNVGRVIAAAGTRNSDSGIIDTRHESADNVPPEGMSGRT